MSREDRGGMNEGGIGKEVGGRKQGGSAGKKMSNFEANMGVGFRMMTIEEKSFSVHSTNLYCSFKLLMFLSSLSSSFTFALLIMHAETLS